MHYWDIFLFLGGLTQALRALAHYNLLLALDNKKPANYFHFMDNLSIWAMLLFAWYLIPLKKDKFKGYEKRVKYINILLIITYICLIILFIRIILGNK